MEKVFEGEGVNPDLRLTVEATILEQVESGNPPETGKAYRALPKAGVRPRDACHVVGRIVSEVMWEVLHMADKQQRRDQDLYIRKLRHLAEQLLKVLNEQIRRLRDGL